MLETHKRAAFNICTQIFVAFFALNRVFGDDQQADATERDGDKIVLAQLVYRHGQRSPNEVCKTDYFQEHVWPEGFTNLSPAGIRQQFELGRRLKRRYVDQLRLVPAKYNRKHIYVRSTDIDRTLVSAMANVAGFYAADDDDEGSVDAERPRLAPVPVHTVSAKEDFLRESEGRPTCPARQKMLKALLRNTPEFRNLMRQNQAAFDEISRNCGERVGFFAKDGARLHAGLIAGNYRILALNNMSMPSWLTPELHASLKEFGETEVAWKNGLDTPKLAGVELGDELARLRGGPLLWTLIDAMRAKAAHLRGDGVNTSAARKRAADVLKNIDERRLIHYSSHDTNIAALLGALGLPTNVDRRGYVPFASTLLFELWQRHEHNSESVVTNSSQTSANDDIAREQHNATTSFYVKVFFWPGIGPGEQRPAEIDISGRFSGCDEGRPCSLSQFAARSEKRRPFPETDERCVNPTDLSKLLEALPHETTQMIAADDHSNTD